MIKNYFDTFVKILSKGTEYITETYFRCSMTTAFLILLIGLNIYDLQRWEELKLIQKIVEPINIFLWLVMIIGLWFLTMIKYNTRDLEKSLERLHQKTEEERYNHIVETLEDANINLSEYYNYCDKKSIPRHEIDSLLGFIDYYRDWRYWFLKNDDDNEREREKGTDQG